MSASPPLVSNIINNLPNNIHLPKLAFQKMLFIMNALEEGWTIKKSHDSYIFTKKTIFYTTLNDMLELQKPFEHFNEMIKNINLIH